MTGEEFNRGYQTLLQQYTVYETIHIPGQTQTRARCVTETEDHCTNHRSYGVVCTYGCDSKEKLQEHPHVHRPQLLELLCSPRTI